MELNGVITELIDAYSGFIEDQMGNNYYFSVADFIDKIDLKVGIKVLFKPIIIGKINKAVLISLKK